LKTPISKRSKSRETVKKIEKYIGDIFLRLLRLFIVHETLTPEEVDHSAIKSILVILRHRMGDMLCATPMIRSLRKFYPGSRITIVTKDSTSFKKLYGADDQLVDEIIEFENGFENFISLIKELRDKKIDLAVVPSTVVFSATNHLIAYYSQAKVRAGVSSMDQSENKCSFLLNVKKDFLWDTRKVHQIERNLDIIRQLKIEVLEKRIYIHPGSENEKFAQDFFSRHFPDRTKRVAAFHPGAGKAGNIWPPAKFAELASRLVRNFNVYILISEGPQDHRYVNEMRNLLNEKYKVENHEVFCGFLLNDVALISLTDLFVCNDTGLMHLAAGLDVPQIALFGPTIAEIWGPLGQNKFSVQSPTSDIDDISVEVVFDICKVILEENNA
jgi:ADP-heptose:LPS heptosyltransferase